MNTLYNLNYEIKFIIALLFVLVPTIIFFGIRIIAADACNKKAKLLNMNSDKWEFLAFIIPIISMVVIHNMDSFLRLHKTIKKWGIMIQLIIVIEVAFIGIATFKIIKVSNYSDEKFLKQYSVPWRVFQDRGLKSIKIEKRNDEIKSILTNLLIGTCALGGIIYLIRISK